MTVGIDLALFRRQTVAMNTIMLEMGRARHMMTMVAAVPQAVRGLAAILRAAVLTASPATVHSAKPAWHN